MALLLGLWCFTSLTVIAAWSPQFIDGIDKEFGCNCVLKDLKQAMTKNKLPVIAMNPDEAPPRIFLPNAYYMNPSNGLPMRERMVKEPSYLERLMSSIFQRRAAVQQTKEAVEKAREDQEERLLIEKLHEAQDDPSAMNGALAALGRRVASTYIKKMRRRWNLFEKFDCKCSGNFVEILRAKHYIQLKIIHD